MKIFNRVICAGLVGLSVAGSHTSVYAQDPEGAPPARNDGEATGITIQVISLTAILGTAAYTRHHSEQANARKSFHSRSVIEASGDLAMSPVERHTSTQNASLAYRALEGTVPGDVIQVKYTAGTMDSLSSALVDLKNSHEVWMNRVTELAQDRVRLTTELTEARSLVEWLKGDEARFRNSAMANAVNVESQIATLDKVIADSNKRMHAAGAQYQSAFRSFESAKKAGIAHPNVPIVWDILVDKNAHLSLRSFFAFNLTGKTAAAAKKAIPRIHIVRVQSANAELAAGSLKRMRGGLAVLGVGAVVLVEEYVHGAIANSIGDMRAKSYSPEIRTEPRGATDY